MDKLSQIRTKFELTAPSPGEAEVYAQLGRQFADVRELITALYDVAADLRTHEHLLCSGVVIRALERGFKGKSEPLKVSFAKLDRPEVLQILANLVVSTVGVAHMLGLALEAALTSEIDEVNHG